MNDFCPIKRVDHLELYVGNARQAAAFYTNTFGFSLAAYAGPEAGCRDHASYVLRQGDIQLVLTAALSPDHPVARFAYEHGDGVAVIGLEVPDAAQAFDEATRRGAIAAAPPKEVRDEHGVFRHAAIRAYGDLVIAFIEREDYSGLFAPGFTPVEVQAPPLKPVGLLAIDHIVGNVARGEMDRWVHFFAETMGFTQLVHFDDKKISTKYSALMSKVMQDGTGRVKFPINEPASGKAKSQIQEYLDYYRGAGVQHVACSTDHIVNTVTALQERGVQFLRVPSTYYEDLTERVGPINEPVDRLPSWGFWSIATMRDICCRSSRSPWRIGRRCSSK